MAGALESVSRFPEGVRRCPGCHQGTTRRAGYCPPCHAAYQRAHRPKHSELTPEQRRKANCRAYTNVLIGRGKLTRQACGRCNAARAEAHHLDYSDPRTVRWLCRPCHRRHHRNQENRRRATAA